MIIAIDGPAASGKGTLAKRLAQYLGFHCLDTGLLYRAVARDTAAMGLRLDDTWGAVAAARGLDAGSLDDPALRGAAAGEAASIVARIAEVRAALLEYQRSFARQSPGTVLDGRDIATVVCPDARVKIFVTASAEERARRRWAELEGRGDAPPYEEVLADIRARDKRDSERSAAPLLVAADAVVLDTTTMDPDAVLAAAIAIVGRQRGA